MRIFTLLVISVGWAIVSNYTYAYECLETRIFSAQDYWFWYAYHGVANEKTRGKILKGHLVLNPTICFQVGHAEIADDMARTRGYKKAFTAWLFDLAMEGDEWREDTDITSIRVEMENIVGRSFASLKELKQWWIENQDYLRWSDEANHLVVVEKAKQSQSLIDKEMLEISATEYWSQWAQGSLRNVREKSNFLLATAWFSPHGEQEIRVRKASLRNRADKQKGFYHALSVLILGNISAPNISQASLNILNQHLQKLTQLLYTNPEDWIKWYKRNKDQLELSSDGTHLVVSTNRK